jgi:hypothetical protein
MNCPDCGLCLDNQRSKNRTGAYNTIAHYNCPKCRDEYIVWEEMKPGCYAIEKGKYRLYCDPEKNKCEVQRVGMDIQSDTSIMYRWYSILELDAIPQNVTEENFDDKIKTLLIFS